MSVETLLTTTVATTLRQLTDRIGVCLEKLTPEQIWARGSENENAVGNLVLHLAGNVTAVDHFRSGRRARYPTTRP